MTVFHYVDKTKKIFDVDKKYAAVTEALSFAEAAAVSLKVKADWLVPDLPTYT